MNALVSHRFFAVFRTEVLFNLKRVAPYALVVLFSGNALLWWGWGPAITRGWAVNSDFYIVRLFVGFSFLTLPLFIPLIMGDPVIRDFRIGVDPLIFSKPVSRAEYLLGKFFGNFFVLVCCQACFALTMLLLQGFNRSGMIVRAPRLMPYLQHFFFFTVVSSLLLAVIYFTVGTLTRNVKIVYGLAVSLYVVYIAWQNAIKGLPVRWRVLLDPMMFNVAALVFEGQSAARLNQVSISYDGDMIANRVAMLVLSLLCLALVYFRFSTTERATGGDSGQGQISVLNLAPAYERLYHEPELSHAPEANDAVAPRAHDETAPAALPRVAQITEGWRASLAQLAAALAVEFRLLLAERSLAAIAPLVMFVCGLELIAYNVAPEATYSAAYARRTNDALLLFLFGIAVFYTGESIHRDRETRIEPVLWSTPAPNFALLCSKFAATLLLSLSLITLVGFVAVGIQIYKGHAPLRLQDYLSTYALISLPSVIFMTAAAIALNVLLRDKYLTYAASLGLGGAFYYLAGQGYQHPLYNPLLSGRWTPFDLVNGGGNLKLILIHRVYCLALSILLLALALLCFERKSSKGLRDGARLSGKAWTIFTAVASLLAAFVTGFIINSRT